MLSLPPLLPILLMQHLNHNKWIISSVKMAYNTRLDKTQERKCKAHRQMFAGRNHMGLSPDCQLFV